MIPGSAWETRLECPHCGNRYVPPWREGSFRCSVCGGALPSGRRSPSIAAGVLRLLPLVAFAGVALTLATAPVSRRWPAGNQPAVALDTATGPRGRQEFRVRMGILNLRAHHRENVHRDPNRAGPRLEVARDIYQDVWQQAAPHVKPSPPSRDAAREDSGSEWVVQVERYVSAHLRHRVAPGLEHAAKAVRLASNAREEIEARRLRAEGLRLTGRYRRAMFDYRWLESVMPGVYTDLYIRCYEHLRLPVPRTLPWAHPADPLRPEPGPPHRANALRLRQSLAGAERLARRWPKDGWPQSYLGSLCFDLARESAALRSDFPTVGPDDQARVDAFTDRCDPDWIRRSVEHYRRAAALEARPWVQARALVGAARGLLVQGRAEEAIMLLRRALALAPSLPDAGSLLSAASQRQAWLQRSLQPPPAAEAIGDHGATPPTAPASPDAARNGGDQAPPTRS